MQKLSELLVMTVCIFASITASAVDWVALAESNDDNVQVYLDIDSIKPYPRQVVLGSADSNYMSGFAHFSYLDEHEYRKKGWSYTQYYFIVNCDDNSYYTPRFNIYNSKDKVLESYHNKYFSANDFNIAFPNSLGYFVIHDMCLFSRQ